MQGALNMLGLCARAGQMKSGMDACEQAVRSGSAQLVLMDGGASGASRKRLETACGGCGVMLRTLPADALGQAIGRPGRMAVAVTGKGFAKRIGELIDGENERMGRV